MINVEAPRTDLAVEAREMLTRDAREDIPGVQVETEKNDEIVITRVNITTPQAEQVMGKSQGKYVTIEAKGLRYKNNVLQEQVMKYFAKELVELAHLNHKATVLVVGLGNWDITPDALGPRVISKIVVTRHIQHMISPELKDGVRSVCAVSPGVLGVTGIETAEIIIGIVEKVKPDLVIAIDALAAAASGRVLTTIQITNTGIHPGSGIGNRRRKISQESLNVPVIAVGIPTVVHASTIAMDTIAVLQEHASFSRYFKSMQSISSQDRRTKVNQVLPELLGDLIVTPKEVDILIEDMAEVVAGGINQALHPHIDHQNIYMYLA